MPRPRSLVNHGPTPAPEPSTIGCTLPTLPDTQPTRRQAAQDSTGHAQDGDNLHRAPAAHRPPHAQRNAAESAENPPKRKTGSPSR